jgi:hypothetical protein
MNYFTEQRLMANHGAGWSGPGKGCASHPCPLGLRRERAGRVDGSVGGQQGLLPKYTLVGLETFACRSPRPATQEILSRIYGASEDTLRPCR